MIKDQSSISSSPFLMLDPKRPYACVRYQDNSVHVNYIEGRHRHADQLTITFRNESEISSREGGSNLSPAVDTPAASRSCMSFRSTVGTASSVARIVNRII